MKRLVAAAGVVSAAFLACQAPSPADVPPVDSGNGSGLEDAGITVNRATCDAPIGGSAPLPQNFYEARPGYDQELAALDLKSVPEVLDLTPLAPLFRAYVAYMLEKDPATMGLTLNRDETLAIEPMGKAVVAAFAVAQRNAQTGLDLPFLRRGLHRFYQCARRFPLTLREFKLAILDYTGLDTTMIELSRPKCTQRRLIGVPERQIWVAETMEDGGVRETEMVMGGFRSDGQLDFVAYDHDGNLTDRGPFATTAGGTIISAAPYTCLACHFESHSSDAGTYNKFSLVFPNVGGCSN